MFHNPNSKHLRNLQLPLFFDFLAAWATKNWTRPQMTEIDNTNNTVHFRHVSSCSHFPLLKCSNSPPATPLAGQRLLAEFVQHVPVKGRWVWSRHHNAITTPVITMPSQPSQSIRFSPSVQWVEFQEKNRGVPWIQYWLCLPGPHWGKQKAKTDTSEYRMGERHEMKWTWGNLSKHKTETTPDITLPPTPTSKSSESQYSVHLHLAQGSPYLGLQPS